MEQEKTFEISLSKVLHAQMWRVRRMLTRVQDFPKFVPCIKDAAVISRDHNHLKTRWKVQVEGVPIQWVEEDTLSLSQNMISFEAVEGDLDHFRGAWHLAEHPEGTQVSVNVSLGLSLPVVGDFAATYLRKAIASNFEAILEGIERRIVSTRYERYRRGETDKLAGFGIVGHLYNYYHLERSLQRMNPGYKLPSREFLSKLFHVSPSFKVSDIKEFRSLTGDSVDGLFVVATFIPDMIENDIWGVFSKVVKACKVAEKAGVGVVSLGGFASIVADRVGREVAQEVDVPVTSGNTFTAAMVVESVAEAARCTGLPLQESTVTVVGGSGDIGTACCRALCGRVKHLTVTGRNKHRLHSLKTELEHGSRRPVTASLDNKAAVREADIVIAAASVSTSILDVQWFKPGAIVCDVGYPKNVNYVPGARQDILCYFGGLTRLPSPLALPIEIGLSGEQLTYACFAEAIILALEKRFERYSFGRGNITLERLTEMQAMGAKHGFRFGGFYWGETPVSQECLERLRQSREHHDFSQRQ